MTPKLLTPILLPTEDASLICITDKKELDFTIKFLGTNGIGYTPHHLHLTSSAPIKSGDWFYSSKTRIVDKANYYVQENLEFKVEFTTDSKLISEGVLPIDGNTKAIVETVAYDTKTKKGIIVNEVPFLPEFCKRYNQTSNQKVDVEKLADDYAIENGGPLTFWATRKDLKDAVKYGYNQALQSSSGGYSLEDVIGFADYYYHRICKDKTHEQFTRKQLFEQYIQSLPSSSSSPSGFLTIELLEGVLTFK